MCAPAILFALACSSPSASSRVDAGVAPPHLVQAYTWEHLKIDGIPRFMLQRIYGTDDRVPDRDDVPGVTRAIVLPFVLTLVFDSPLDRKFVEKIGGPGLREDLITVTCDGVESVNTEGDGEHSQEPGIVMSRDVLTQGPALLIPIKGLRTGADCAFELHPEVVGLNGVRVCAPRAEDPEGSCAPGDMSAVEWKTEPLALAGSDPADGDTEVPTTTTPIALAFSAPVDLARVGAIELRLGEAEVPVTVQFFEDDPASVRLRPVSAMQPNSEYTIEVANGPGGLLGARGGLLGAPVTLHFTTADF